jgi:hypothetical protein
VHDSVSLVSRSKIPLITKLCVKLFYSDTQNDRCSSRVYFWCVIMARTGSTEVTESSISTVFSSSMSTSGTFLCVSRGAQSPRAIPIDSLPEAILRLKQWIDTNAFVHFPVEVCAQCDAAHASYSIDSLCEARRHLPKPVLRQACVLYRHHHVSTGHSAACCMLTLTPSVWPGRALQALLPGIRRSHDEPWGSATLGQGQCSLHAHLSITMPRSSCVARHTYSRYTRSGLTS